MPSLCRGTHTPPHSHLPSTHTHLPSTHPLSPALGPQVKLCFRLLVVQPLLDIHQWASAVVHLVHHIGLGLVDTHNHSHKHAQSEVSGEEGEGGWRKSSPSLVTSCTHCPTVTSTLTPQSSLSPPNSHAHHAAPPKLPMRTPHWYHTTVPVPEMCTNYLRNKDMHLSNEDNSFQMYGDVYELPPE